MQDRIQCVIPCGGNSSRMGSTVSKCLLNIGRRSVLEHVVTFWQARGVADFIFIVGGNDTVEITEHAQNISNNPIVIDRKNNTNLLKAVNLAEPYITGKFVLALGDCLNFGEFIGDCEPLGAGVCVASDYEFKKSYSVQTDGNGITKMVEKPVGMYGLCGMGTLFLDRRIFKYIERLNLKNNATSADFTGMLQLAIGEGETVSPVYFKGEYINITYPEDIATAKRLLTGYTSMQIVSRGLCC